MVGNMNKELYIDKYKVIKLSKQNYTILIEQKILIFYT